MPWSDAEIAAVGTSIGAIITCVVTAYLTLRKDRRQEDGTAIGHWRSIATRKDREIDRLNEELEAERRANNGYQVQCATLKAENRYLRDRLGLGPSDPCPASESSLNQPRHPRPGGKPRRDPPPDEVSP